MNLLRTREPHLAPNQLPRTPVVWSVLDGEEVVLYQRADEQWVYHEAPAEMREFVPDTTLSFAFVPERVGDVWAWHPQVAQVRPMYGDAD